MRRNLLASAWLVGIAGAAPLLAQDTALLRARFAPMVQVTSNLAQARTHDEPWVGPEFTQRSGFGRLVDQLSEEGGYFQSDNLVSNETSYLHALDSFRALELQGGAFIGVGPETGFSYIAEIEPEIAFIIDIRRDNLLLHLLLKTVFDRSRNRLEYLCLLFGRPAPSDLAMWTELPLGSLVEYIDRTPVDSALHEQNHAALMKRVGALGVPLSGQDTETLKRFHDEFAFTGLDLRYTTRGRMSPRLSFPTIRQLYLETDLGGAEGSYLASEDRWRVVRDLERRDRIVPVVGDLAGPKAMKAIGDYLRRKRQTVTVFYVSNVESYLFRGGRFPAFVENVRALPIRSSSVLVRSWFGRGAMLPGSVPGHFSTQITQMMTRFLAVTAIPDSVSYWTLLTDPLLVQPAPAGSRPPPP